MSDKERDSIREMEDIQKGLEAFLQQEMQDMQVSGTRRSAGRPTANDGIRGAERQTEKHPAPQMYDMREDDEDEEEPDVIGSDRRSRSREDYAEDWDDPVYRKRQAARMETARRDAESRNSGNRSRSRREDYADEYEDYEEDYEEYNDRKRSGRRADRREETDTKADKKKRKNNKKAVKSRKKKKSGLKRFLIAVVLIIAFLAAGLYVLVGKVYGKMTYEKVDAVASSPMKEDGVTNILLIGNDSRENGEDGRSDAMILLSISNKTKKIYMTSLLRDMYVDIPGHKGNRLNAAYSYGGAELLMETIEQNFDIHISRYVLVNFEAFANLVDAVGGVDLELTGKEVEYVNGYLVEYNILLGRPEGTDYFEDTSGGMVHLNGPQALAYCRNRYIGTDFGRTERQRKVLTAVIHKLPQGMLTNSQGLIDGLMPNLTTNLTQTECYQLGLMAPKAVTYDIIQNSIPLEGTYKDATIREMAVLEVDFEANKKFLKENLYGDGTTAE